VNPRSLMLTEGSIIGVMLAGATKVSFPYNLRHFTHCFLAMLWELCVGGTRPGQFLF
jgi:hypothetical protein